MRQSDTATVVFSNPSRTVRVYAVRIDFRILSVALSLCRKITKITNNNFNLKIIMNYNPEMKLSENFQLKEFVASQTAERLKIDNRPGWEAVINLRNLCQEVLQPLRNYAAEPIHINSGYRCEALNEAVHGVGNSQHLYGEAADIHLPSLATGRRWYEWLVNHTDFDQLLFEYRRGGSRWLHLSCRRNKHENRHMAFPNYPVAPRRGNGGTGCE